MPLFKYFSIAIGLLFLQPLLARELTIKEKHILDLIATTNQIGAEKDVAVKSKSFLKFVLDNVDYEFVGDMTLGHYARQMTPEQLNTFKDEITPCRIASLFGTHLKPITDPKPTIKELANGMVLFVYGNNQRLTFTLHEKEVEGAEGQKTIYFLLRDLHVNPYGKLTGFSKSNFEETYNEKTATLGDGPVAMEALMAEYVEAQKSCIDMIHQLKQEEAATP